MKTREQLEATGNKILNSVRTELYLSMRFMGPALGSLGFAMDLSTRTVGTDAVYIRFNPTYLLQTYIERPEILNRTYMHMLMHCLFRHMFSAKQHEDAQLWDLCCDIAVESVVDSMDYPTILRVTSDFRQEWYENWKRKFQCLQRKNCTSILCCANAIHIWKNPSGRNFCSVTTVSGSAWRKNRRRSRIKPAPGAAGESADGQ